MFLTDSVCGEVVDVMDIVRLILLDVFPVGTAMERDSKGGIILGHIVTWLQIELQIKLVTGSKLTHFSRVSRMISLAVSGIYAQV